MSNIDSAPRRVRVRRRILREILAGAGIVLAMAAALYGLYQYRRARITVGPMVQLSADGTPLVTWQTAGAAHSRLDVYLKDAASQGTGSAVSPRPKEALSIEPTATDGRFVAPLPRVLTNRPSLWYSLRTSIPLLDRSTEPRQIRPPQVGAPFRFVVFGESGGSLRPGTMAAAILKTEPQLVLHIGDLIYETGQWPADYGSLYREQFGKPYRILVGTVPFMPVIGQHEARIDAGGPFRRFFVLPRNGPDGVPAGLSYWFDYGPARFVGIDASVRPEALQNRIVPWLRAALGDAPADWKFVCMERSPYAADTANPEDQAVEQILVPALEQLGVDAVFCAGHHRYERTYPLARGEARPAGEGVVYVTTGAGGRGLSLRKRPLPPHTAACEDRAYSFTFVELDGGRFHLRQVGEYGQLIDDWWFAKPTR